MAYGGFDDSTEVEKDLITISKSLAKEKDCTVVITGKEDIVSDEKKTFLINNGDEIMSHVVGTGCMATSVIGTFCAAEEDLAVAAASGLCCYEIAAELAAKECSGPGTFKETLFDKIYNLDEKTINEYMNIE